MWRTVKLGEVSKIISGNSIPAKKKEELFTNVEGVPYVATKDLGFDGSIDFENGVSIPEMHVSKFKISPPNSTLVCAEGGSAGRKIAFSERECCFVNKLFSITPLKNLDAKYVYYYTLGDEFQSQFKDALHGLIGGVSLSKIKDFFISFPPLEEQQRIVAKLDAAFTEIDRAINATKIKIQNYFKLEESNKSSFFSNLSSSLIELEKTSEIKNGYAFKSGDFQHSNGVPVIKITNVGIRDFVETNDVNLPKSFLASHKQFAVKQGDIVFALTRTVINGGLKVAIVPKNYEGALLNQRVASVSANPKMMNSEFLYSFLSSPMVLDYVLSNVNTLMQPNLSITDLKKLPVPNITVDEQVTYSQKLKETEIQFKNIRTIETKKLSELETLKLSILAQAMQPREAA